MSTNLRLGDELAAALREAAQQRGQSQQQIVREALAKELGLNRSATAMERAIRAGTVKPPRQPEAEVSPVRLRRGTTTLDLLDRDDR